MTTAIYDGRYLVADTRVTSAIPHLENASCPHCNAELGKTVYRERNKITVPQKLVYLCGHKVLCFATIGRINITDLIKEVLMKSSDVEVGFKQLMRHCAALNDVVPAAKLLVITDGGPIVLDIRNGLKKVSKDSLPLCLGSGADSAQTAMMLGTKIFGAIEVVNKIDSDTGKNFTYVDTHAKNLSVIRVRMK